MLILLGFTYNLTAIWVDPFADPYIGGSLAGSFNTWNALNGSINSLSNCLKLVVFTPYTRNSITGNIEIAFANSDRLIYIRFAYVTVGTTTLLSGDSPSTNISGNISVFSNKYNLEGIQINHYSNIYGHVNTLKNLKKLNSIYLEACSCTGSQTDLYNQGANITHFGV